MRVLITGATYSPSLNGQAIFTTNLAEGLVKRGHEVLVAFPADPQTPFLTEQNGVRLLRLNSVNLGFIHKDVYAPIYLGRRTTQAFDDFRPHLIHIQDHYPPSLSVVRFAQQRGIKVIGTNHFMPENVAPYVPLLPKFKRFYNWLAWRWVLDVYNRVDVVTAQSQAAMKILRAQGRLEADERFCRFPREIVLYCVAKDDQELLETIRRLEQCRTNRLLQPPTPEPEQP